MEALWPRGGCQERGWQKAWSTDEHLVATETGEVVRAWPDNLTRGVAVDADRLLDITGQPSGPQARLCLMVRCCAAMSQRCSRGAMRTKSQQRYLDNVGLTPSHIKCRALQRVFSEETILSPQAVDQSVEPEWRLQ